MCVYVWYVEVHTYVYACWCCVCVWCVHTSVTCVGMCVNLRVHVLVLVAGSMRVSPVVSALEQEAARWPQCGWPRWGLLLILAPWAGLVMEGKCAGVGDVRALHSGDCQHGGGRHLYPDHQQHRAGRLPDHLQLHRLEQLRL